MERRGDETAERTADGDASEGRADRAEPVDLARAYYRALDEGDYDLLADVLAPDFTHERPDRTLGGRDRFVRFMREERPQTDTSHPIDGVYVPASMDGLRDGPVAGDVVVRGRLLAADGSQITSFVDVFDATDGALSRLRTYTH